MNSCEKIQEMISSMLDGELSTSDETLVREHIAQCKDCAAMYEDFASLSNELREGLAEVPASLHSRIMKGVRCSKKPKKPLHIAMRPYMGAAACLVLVVGVVLAAQAGKLGADLAVGSTSKLMDMPAAPAEPAAPAAPADFHAYSFMENAETEEDYGEISSPEAPAMPETPAEPEAPAAPAEPAEPERPAAPAEPAEPERPYVPEIIPGDEDSINEHFQLAYNHYLSFGPPDFQFRVGLPLENVYLALFDDEGKLTEVSLLEDTEALCAALICEDRNWESWDSLPKTCSALLEFECEGKAHCIWLYFDDGSIVVETMDDYYRAVGSVEELLSIK